MTTATSRTKVARRRIGPTPAPEAPGASLAAHPLVLQALEAAQAELEAARQRGTKLLNAAYRRAAAELYPGSGGLRAARSASPF